MELTDLISPAYRDEQLRLHADPRGYGGRGKKWATQVEKLIWLFGAKSVLDYGCGEGSLVCYLRAASDPRFTSFAPRCTDFREYDPAIADKADLPAPADLVVCTDVLEHVEPDKIDTVLDHLTTVTTKVLFVVVSLVETAKTLSDGRQAHILLREPAWWREQFGIRGFTVHEELSVKPEKQWAAVLRREVAA